MGSMMDCQIWNWCKTKSSENRGNLKPKLRLVIYRLTTNLLGCARGLN